MSSKSKRADNFSLNEILERTIQNGKDDVKPLFKYLEVEKPDGWGKKTVKEKTTFWSTDCVKREVMDSRT